MLIFDTSAVIEWLYGNKVVYTIIDQLNIPTFRWYISSVTLYELTWASEYKGKKHVEKVNEFTSNINIISVEKKIAMEAADMKYKTMKKGLDFAMADLFIAASCILEHSNLLTSDKDFVKLSKEFKMNVNYFEKSRVK